jgi:hypothetical protein
MDYKLLAQGLVFAMDMISRIARSGDNDALEQIQALTKKLVGDSTTPIKSLNPEEIMAEMTKHTSRLEADDAEIDRKIAKKFPKDDD